MTALMVPNVVETAKAPWFVGRKAACQRCSDCVEVLEYDVICGLNDSGAGRSFITYTCPKNQWPDKGDVVQAPMPVPIGRRPCRAIGVGNLKFSRVVLVNLDRRTDRMKRVYEQFDGIEWPFPKPQRVRAIDGKIVQPPPWWKAGPGAWGCMMSHLRALEDAMMDGCESILLLEDDMLFLPNFEERLEEFAKELPPTWDGVYLGGQHLHGNRVPPVLLSEHVLRCRNVNRTHAWGFRGKYMLAAYQHITDFLSIPTRSGKAQHHIDHQIGLLHEKMQHEVYAPVEWLIGQDGDFSDVCEKKLEVKEWQPEKISKTFEPQNLPFVAVIGLHRSGSSCLAGCLHKLGVHMGDKLGGHEKTGGYEASGLAWLCEKAFRFPTTECAMEREALREKLQNHVIWNMSSASKKDTIAGGKYPHLCAMVDDLAAVCGDLRILHINRPLDESIESLKERSRKATGWLAISDEDAESVQRWLWEEKSKAIDKYAHLTIEYHDLLKDPEREIKRIIEYLGIEPTDDQVQAAISHVQPQESKFSHV